MLFFVDSRGLGGAVISDSLVMNFILWCILPMNDLNCLSVCGCSISDIAFIFFSVGIIPFRLIL